MTGLGFIALFFVAFFSFLVEGSPSRRGLNVEKNKSMRSSIWESGKDLQQALKELRDARRRHVPEEKRTVFTPVKSRAAPTIEKKSLNRVSFKECNLDLGLRLDCGHYGIDEEGCYKRECCWGETTEPDIPWCYHSKPTIQSYCLLDNNERQECGFYGIRKEQCLGMECCWQPGRDNGVPWCFQHLRVPIFEGECGVPEHPPNVLRDRIVGGQEAFPHSWPWMVSLQWLQGVDAYHICGGSLINNQWIVSAAHCEFPASDLEIVLGMHSQSAGEKSKIRVKVEGIYSHENFGSSGSDSDIMLVKLESPIEFNANVTPVCLPEQDSELSPGKRCYTTGWGDLRSWGSAPDLLQQVMVPIIDQSVCNGSGWYESDVDDTMICAGYEEGGRDSCQGDSGGPLVCLFDGKWTLNGIVSWGFGCAGARKPGVYAKTSKFTDWVESTINKHL